MGQEYPELEETFVIDAVAHNFNLAPSNYYHDHAEAIAELSYDVTETQPDQYRVTKDSYQSK